MKYKMAKETIAQKKARMNDILTIAEKNYPKAGIQLLSHTSFQLMVAVILSAQCTDKRVNTVTEKLFSIYPNPEDYINIEIEELENLIFSTGFYRAKAKNIKAAAQMLIEKYNGIMPNDMENLLTLPGVGRKSANVILGNYYNIPGIVVDTHVKRLARKMGFVETQNPEKIEFELQKLIEIDKWVIFTHYMIEHGRAICKGQKPKCELCPFEKLCPKLL